jgi:hypothetical protein
MDAMGMGMMGAAAGGRMAAAGGMCVAVNELL